MSKREQELEGRYFMDKLERGRKIASEIKLCITNPYSWPTQANVNRDVYLADDIHRLLGEGIEKFGRGGLYQGLWTDRSFGSDTHKGLLIAIRPIEQESEERKLLRELSDSQKYGSQNRVLVPKELIDRAEALLAKEPK